MAVVTITLPDIPAEVDHADMLRACAAQIADGHSLRSLHSWYIQEIVTSLADVVDAGGIERPMAPLDLGHLGGLAWFVDRDGDNEWLVTAAPVVDTFPPAVLLRVQHAEDGDGADARETAAHAVRAAIVAAVEREVVRA